MATIEKYRSEIEKAKAKIGELQKLSLIHI